MKKSKFLRTLICLLVLVMADVTHAQWYLDEPVRFLQTNLPLHQVPEYKAKDLVAQVVEAKANTWLFNVGGIYAYYPTKLEYQTINPFMQPGRDFVGELITEAQKHNIRVMGRFDFSLFTNELAAKHPEWCFRRNDGSVVSFNGLTNSCINSPYYQQYAFNILEEAFIRYRFHGILINWWGNHANNSYVDKPNGICHCEHCIEQWAESHDHPLPNEFTDEYTKWHDQIRRKLEQRIQNLADKYHPDLALVLFHLTGGRDQIEGFTVETRTGNATNEWWLYESTYYMNLYRNSYPDKATFNTVVNFINFNFRFGPHRKSVNQARIYQSMAHGSFPGIYMIGMPKEHDVSGAEAIYEPYAFHENIEEEFVHQENMATIYVIDDHLSDQMKGIINVLSENHIPYKLIHTDKIKDQKLAPELMITTGFVNDEMQKWVNAGSKLLVIGNKIPEGFQGFAVAHMEDADAMKSYWSVDDAVKYPRASAHRHIPNLGAYVQLKENKEAGLHLIPPAMTGPPEKVWNDVRQTNIAGIAEVAKGRGKITWIPWNAGTHYHLHANAGIHDFLLDVILGQTKIDFETNAHPLVETSVMHNKENGKYYIHLINHTGQLHGSSSKIVPMQGIDVRIKGDFKTVVKGSDKSQIRGITYKDGFTHFTLDRLDAYEMVILKPGK
ncbi:MAG: beta-galactosidase [Saprospiraceae bacterium]|nr:beta-galactosidase [Saprospiraceae bacterium]